MRERDSLHHTIEQERKESRALIISGFTGIGKSFVTHNSSTFKVIDIDSEPFSRQAEKKFERHPNWPQNYTDHILDNKDNSDLLFVSAHRETREALVSAQLNFFLIYPSLEMKYEYMKRYENRGNNQDFIRRLNQNYEIWIQELMQQKDCQHLVLKPGQYLSDVIEDVMNTRNQIT